jgi:hypothetical protein
MKRLHFIVGLAGLLAFATSGQLMRLHQPAMRTLADGPRLMYLSRHIYLLGASLVNLMLGLYLQMEATNWRRNLQIVGSVLIVISPVLLALAFVSEPEFGIAGRSARSAFGVFTLLGGAIAHFAARVKPAEKIDRSSSGL